MNSNDHWCIAIIDLRVKEIKYFVSLARRNKKCSDNPLEYLTYEMMDKKNCRLVRGDLHLVLGLSSPQQRNSSDFGMFALKYADHAAQGAKINFTQADMPCFRRRTMIGIVKSTISLSSAHKYSN